MTKQNSIEPLWPYLLFLPAEYETRDEFLRTVLASRLARNVLSSFDEEGRVLQRDLIEKLPHSNKSVLAYLKTLRKFDLINTGSTIRSGKRIVVHELTKTGWGLSRFYFEGLPYDVEDLTAFLLEDYLTRLATLYREQGIPESTLFEIFARMRSKAMLDGSKDFTKPTFVLVGASAFNTRIRCDELPPLGGLASCSSPVRQTGGSTVELALSLAKEGFETSLISSVGNDIDGWNIIANLIQGDVDVRHIVVEDDKHTNESIIITEGKKGSRTLVGISPMTSLSITSPDQVPWYVLENSKAIYIGEVFIEVAATIAAYAKVHGIPTVYRCSVPYWEFGIVRLKPVLSQVDTLLISHRVWKYLKQNIGPRPLQTLREITDAAIIVKQSKNKYRLSLVGEKDRVLSCECDSTDISELFVTGLLKKITEGVEIHQAVESAMEFECR
ncbi:MAG: carbohydrate kinase family protein [Candidatus Thorarchaeota archaeon]